MSDIATLGLAVDSTQVVQATQALDKLTAAGERTQASANKVGTEVQRQTSAMQQTVSATAQATASIDRSSKAYQDLDREIEKIILSSNKALSAQAQLGRAQATLGEGLDKGILSQRAYDSALASVTAKYGPAAEGVTKLATAHGATTVSAGFLTRELRALGDELASGRTRQAEGTFALLTTRLAGLGPVGIAAAAGVAAVGVAAAVIIGRSEDMARALKADETGFQATGNAALLSETQLKSYSDRMALLPGVSRDAAEKSIAELSRVPYITGPLFQRSTAIAADFAAMLGTDVPKATAVLAKALDDPAGASAQLDKQFNLLTVDQRLLIDSYVQHGDKAGALTVLLQALEDRSRGLAMNGLTPMQKASNDVGNAWDGLLKTFGDTGAINTGGNAIAGLIEIVSRGIVKIGQFREGMKSFYSTLLHSQDEEMYGVQGAPKAATTPTATYRPSDNYGEGSGATAQSTSGQSERVRTLLDETKGYQSRAAANKVLLDQEGALKKLLDDGNLSLAARGQIQDRIAGIQERLAKGGATKVEPLGLNVDKASLDAALKANDAIAEAQKREITEQQRFDDFKHSSGLESDRQYYDAKIAAVDRYLNIETQRIEKDVALRRAADAELARLTPQSKGQGDEISTARITNQRAIDELLAKEQETRTKMGNDRTLLVMEEQRAERITATNAALARTQEIQTKLRETDELIDLQVQLGTKTQTEGAQARQAATLSTINALQKQRDVLVELRASDEAIFNEADAAKKTKAIEQINIQLLKIKAELDPIAKKLNSVIDTGFVDFLDKIGSGGVKSFKDLKTAALSYLTDIEKAVSHEVNQSLSDSLMKSLGLKGEGSNGGIGAAITKYLGLSGNANSATAQSAGTQASASGDPASGLGQSFTDLIGATDKTTTGLDKLSEDGIGSMAKSSAAYLEKLVFGTTVETTSTSATASATSAISSMATAATAAAEALRAVATSGSGGSSGGGGMMGGGGGGGGGGISSLFGDFFGGFGGGSSGAAAGTAGDSVNVGITDEALALFHSGGIVGSGYATRQVRYSQADVDAAPRFHSGGISGLNGYNEQLAVLQKGEEVLPANDPRHRNNVSKKNKGEINVTNNFVLPRNSNLFPESQHQIARNADMAIRRAKGKIG